MGADAAISCSEIAQITFFAFTTPIVGGGRGEDVVVMEEQRDDRVRNVGCLAVHVTRFPPLPAVVDHLHSTNQQTIRYSYRLGLINILLIYRTNCAVLTTFVMLHIWVTNTNDN